MVEAGSGGLIESVVQLVGEFGKVATVDPISAVLLLLGAVLTGVSVVVFGYLTVGAVLAGLGDLIPSPSSPGGPPREHE
jgi:hypothetical protein